VIRTDPANSWGWFDPSVPTLADELKQAGYHTAIVGKWHLGLESPNTPNERGFDFFHGFLGDMMDSYTTHLRHGQNYMRRNADIIQPRATPRISSPIGPRPTCANAHAIATNRSSCFSPTTRPIFPSNRRPIGSSGSTNACPDLAPDRALNVAFVEHLDDGIGRVLATLQETGSGPQHAGRLHR
jgi:hypothetical protein